MGKTLQSKTFPKKPGMTPVEVCLRKSDSSSYHPWVTHLRDASLPVGGYYWGHYFDSATKAAADYRKRLQEEFEACKRAGLLVERQRDEYTSVVVDA